MNGLNLYNVLRGMPITLTTHNVGNVDSTGNAVFLAGQKRYACPHSTFMFHGVAFNRARIAAAQRVRWAKTKGQKVFSIGSWKRRKLSAAAIARIRAAQKARWAKWRKAKKTA